MPKTLRIPTVADRAGQAQQRRLMTLRNWIQTNRQRAIRAQLNTEDVVEFHQAVLALLTLTNQDKRVLSDQELESLQDLDAIEQPRVPGTLNRISDIFLSAWLSDLISAHRSRGLVWYQLLFTELRDRRQAS